MAGSRSPGSVGTERKATASRKFPPRTPGPLGRNDAADPNVKSHHGDTPGPLGTSGDAASHIPGVKSTLTVGVAEDPVPEKRYKGYSIKDKSELFFDPKESPTFAKIWQESIELQVQIAPFDEMKATDAAYYDPLQNAIFISPDEFKQPRSKTTRLSTAHELYHAIQNKDVLENARTFRERKRLIEQRMMAMSEDEFVRRESQREQMAEAIAWKCDGEAIDSFARSQKGETGFPRKFLQDIVRERVKEYWDQQSKVYVEKARKRYRDAKLRQSTEP
jgi:hypothetical protein